MLIPSHVALTLLDEARKAAEDASDELLALHKKGIPGGLLWDAARARYRAAYDRCMEIDIALAESEAVVGSAERMVFLRD
jgi:hypothetical protein